MDPNKLLNPWKRFVVISREQKLIESKIKLNTTFNKYLTNKAVLFNAMGLVIPSLEP